MYMNKNSKLIIAFLSGMATGALLGLFFAPDSGSNTRDKLSYQLDKYLQKLNALLNKPTGGGGKGKESTAISDIQSLEDKKKAEELLREVESLLTQIHNHPTN